MKQGLMIGLLVSGFILFGCQPKVKIEEGKIQTHPQAESPA